VISSLATLRVVMTAHCRYDGEGWMLMNGCRRGAAGGPSSRAALATRAAPRRIAVAALAVAGLPGSWAPAGDRLGDWLAPVRPTTGAEALDGFPCNGVPSSGGPTLRYHARCSQIALASSAPVGYTASLRCPFRCEALSAVVGTHGRPALLGGPSSLVGTSIHPLATAVAMQRGDGAGPHQLGAVAWQPYTRISSETVVCTRPVPFSAPPPPAAAHSRHPSARGVRPARGVHPPWPPQPTAGRDRRTGRTDRVARDRATRGCSPHCSPRRRPPSRGTPTDNPPDRGESLITRPSPDGSESP
jgi:hypothetical protein